MLSKGQKSFKVADSIDLSQCIYWRIFSSDAFSYVLHNLLYFCFKQSQSLCLGEFYMIGATKGVAFTSICLYFGFTALSPNWSSELANLENNIYYQLLNLGVSWVLSSKKETNFLHQENTASLLASAHFCSKKEEEWVVFSLEQHFKLFRK